MHIHCFITKNEIKIKQKYTFLIEEEIPSISEIKLCKQIGHILPQKIKNKGK